jgi:hypothetical protein
MKMLKTKHNAMIDIKNIGILAKYKVSPAALWHFLKNPTFSCNFRVNGINVSQNES